MSIYYEKSEHVTTDRTESLEEAKKKRKSSTVNIIPTHNKQELDRGSAIINPNEGSSIDGTKRRYQHKKGSVTFSDSQFPPIESTHINSDEGIISRVSVDNKHLSYKEVLPVKSNNSSICKDLVHQILEEIIIKVTESTKVVGLNESSLMVKTSISNKGKKMKLSDSLASVTTSKDKWSTNISSSSVLNDVVMHLGLPIFVAKPLPFMDEEVKMEKIILDIHSDEFDSVLEDSETEKNKDEYAPKKDLVDRDRKEYNARSPFEMIWCFGFNSSVPAINVSSNNRYALFFANAQFIVFYNAQDDVMSFLHGHQNNVTCIAIDPQGNFLASADRGPKGRVVIWNTFPQILKTLDNECLEEIELLGISCGGEYLITVSPRCIELWKWKTDTLYPTAFKASTRNLGAANKLTVNSTCPEEFVITYENGIEFILYCKDDINIKQNTSTKTQTKSPRNNEAFQFDCHQISPTLGALTDTVFLELDETSALSSTSKGYIIVWAENKIKQRKIRKKNVRLHLEAITHIVVIDDSIATATVTGKISFFNLELTVLYWTYKHPYGELVSFSFNLTSPRVENEDYNCAQFFARSKIQSNRLFDASLENRPFCVRPFVITTVDGKIVYIDLNNAESTVLIFTPDSIYTAIDIHPKSDYLCAGTSSGKCFLFDHESHKIKVRHHLKMPEGVCQAVAYLRYSSSGNHLACGMYTGTLWLLDPLLLTPTAGSPYNDSSNCITNIVFSDDDRFLAITDQSFCLTVYNLVNEIYVLGVYQAHSKYITNIMFYSGLKDCKLYTLAEDRTLVEFCMPDNENNLKFVKVYRVEQTAIPKFIIPHPTDNEYFLMVNSEFKFKYLRKSDLRCCKTVQAPNFGFPITYLQQTQHYLLYGTAYHIGLHILPLDGNPYKTLAYLASSLPFVCMRVHSSGKYMFTISENSSTINMWKINTVPVERYFNSGGEGLDAFLSVLDGGKNGSQGKELREFFIIGQFLHQGESPGVVRRLSNYINVCEVANIFQGLGYFLTKIQLENMIYELTGSDGPPDKKVISFEDFVQFFVNHRPKVDLSMNTIQQAFRDFYSGVYFTDLDYNLTQLDSDPVFNTSSFVEKLSETGDKIPTENLSKALDILCESKQEPLLTTLDTSLAEIPREITFQSLFTDILGFDGTV